MSADTVPVIPQDPRKNLSAYELDYRFNLDAVRCMLCGFCMMITHRRKGVKVGKLGDTCLERFGGELILKPAPGFGANICGKCTYIFCSSCIRECSDRGERECPKCGHDVLPPEMDLRTARLIERMWGGAFGADSEGLAIERELAPGH
jgi:hypothetical protein